MDTNRCEVSHMRDTYISPDGEHHTIQRQDGKAVIEVDDGGFKRCPSQCAFYNHLEGVGCSVTAPNSSTLLCGENATIYLEPTHDAYNRHIAAVVARRLEQ